MRMQVETLAFFGIMVFGGTPIYMSTEVMAALIASSVAIIGALTSFMVNWLKAKSVQADLSSIKEALGRSDKLYYIVCPNCKTKIYLSRVSIEEDIEQDGSK